MKWTNNIDNFIRTLQHDGVVIFPTDTVWGLGCLVSSNTAIARLYEIKHREQNKPTAILVGSVEQAKEYGLFTAKATELAQKYWPGALTIVVKATDTVPLEIRGPQGTVGLRFSNYPFVQELTRKLGVGLVTGSANFSGEKAPQNREQLDPLLIEKVDAAYEGECEDRPPSTIVDCTEEEYKIIRQGSVVI